MFPPFQSQFPASTPQAQGFQHLMQPFLPPSFQAQPPMFHSQGSQGPTTTVTPANAQGNTQAAAHTTVASQHQAGTSTPARRADGLNDAGFCKYNKCTNPVCHFPHREHQFQPNEHEFNLTNEFSRHNLCRWDHDGTSCVKKECKRDHGRSNAGSAEKCPMLGKGICREFFGSGCKFSHKRY